MKGWDQLVELGSDHAQGVLPGPAHDGINFDGWLRPRRRVHLSVVPPAEEAFGA
jgi:hypothetical protein